MSKRLPPVIIVSLLHFFLLTAVSAAGQRQSIHTEGAPLNGVHDVMFATVWQQPAAAEDFLLAQMTDGAYDRHGDICIVDFQLKNLVILDPDGAWLRTLGREGEGPGEFRDARKVFFDGERYGVLQGYPATIVWLHADGTPAGKVLFGGHDPQNMVYLSAAHAVQSGPDIYAWLRQTRYVGEESTSEVWIARVAPDGQLGPTLYTPPEGPDPRVDGGIDEGKVYDIWLGRWTSDGQGGLWVAPYRDRFVLQHWNENGELVLEVDREYTPVGRNENGKEAITAWFTRRGWNLDQIRVGKTAPVIRGLRIGDDGNLWVRLGLGGRDPASDLVRVYDVIGPSGDYLKQVKIHSALVIDSWVTLDDETALILSTDPEDDESLLSLQKLVAVDSSR